MTPSRGRAAGLTVGALGVVFGDIGTSPLYALRESLEGGARDVPVTADNVLGVVSLIVWALVVVIAIKYLAFVLRADSQGEGGILVLSSLLTAASGAGTRVVGFATALGLFGTALLYGDGMITPAISVLAAMEGVAVAAPGLAHLAVPAAVCILVVLFAVQHRGTATMSRAFGPVMLVWFSVLALLGSLQVVRGPEVLAALDPTRGVTFLAQNGTAGLLALGSVFLVVTGGEALYADMGHFGRRPITVGWFAVAMPGLLLNYLGQGALLLQDPAAIEQPFYLLAPGWAAVPLVVLATLATVIASQALITGAFSLTVQAVRLGYLPRVRTVHTSATERGQVYVPVVNWLLLAACAGLVVGFGSTRGLAAAYGVAVTLTMVITTLLFGLVAHHRFGWSRRRATTFVAAFLVVDVAFAVANLPKVPVGGWFPLVVAAVLVGLMTTWHRGRTLLRARSRRGQVPLDQFLASLLASRPPRVPGTAVHLYGIPGVAPPSLRYQVRLDHALHEDILLVAVVTEQVPYVLPAARHRTTDLGDGIRQVVLRYGFMEHPSVAQDLLTHHAIDAEEAVFLLGREIVALDDDEHHRMAGWRDRLFRWLRRNARDVVPYLGLPDDRVIEIAARVRVS